MNGGRILKRLTKLKDIRKERGVTQPWVAMKLGVARNTVCQWEKGLRTPNLEMLKKLAELFNCTIDELL